MKTLKYPIHKYFKTKNRLEAMLDANFLEVEEFIEDHLCNLYEIDTSLDLIATKGDLEYWGYNEMLDTLENCPEDTSKLCYRYSNSIWPGQSSENFEYIGNIALGPELELQADDGGLAYYYLGYPSLEVYEFKGGSE